MCKGRRWAGSPLPSWGCLLWWWKPSQSAAGPGCWVWWPGAALHEHCEPRWWAEGRSEKTREETAVRTNSCGMVLALGVMLSHNLMSKSSLVAPTSFFGRSDTSASSPCGWMWIRTRSHCWMAISLKYTSWILKKKHWCMCKRKLSILYFSPF